MVAALCEREELRLDRHQLGITVRHACGGDQLDRGRGDPTLPPRHTGLGQQLHQLRPPQDSAQLATRRAGLPRQPAERVRVTVLDPDPVAHGGEHPGRERRVLPVALPREAQQIRPQRVSGHLDGVQADEGIDVGPEVTHGVTQPVQTLAIRPE